MSNITLRELKLNSAVKYITREGFVNNFPITFSYDNPTQLQVFVGFERIKEWMLETRNGLPNVVLPTDLDLGESVTIRRATPSDGVPHTYQFTGNAQGGAEFSAKTLDENFEYLSTIVEEVEDYNTVTQDNLKDIEDNFKETQAVAQEAKDSADEASKKADTAIKTANSAKDTANTSLEQSKDALEASESAVGTSNNALKIAEDANTKSDDAVNTANEADAKADASVVTSNEAKGIASEAKGIANTAESNSEHAISIAEGIDAKATEALSNSQEAVSTAQDAKATAEGIDGKAQNALDTSAEAKDIAEEALSHAVGLGVEQTTGTSKTKAMSQDATTRELNKKWVTQETIGSGKVMREGAYGFGGFEMPKTIDGDPIDKNGFYRIFYNSGSFHYGSALNMQYSESIHTLFGVKSVSFKIPEFIADHYNGKDAERVTVAFHTTGNTIPDKNGVLHVGTRKPVDTLNTSDMVDTVVNNDELTVTSGSVYRALDKKRDLDDNKFKGILELECLGQGVGSGLFFTDGEGGVNGNLICNQDGVQVNNVTDGEMGGSYIFPKREGIFNIATREDLPYVTPEMYGAVGDGVVDDTNALSKALNSGQLLVLPQGKTYNIPKGITTTGKDINIFAVAGTTPNIVSSWKTIEPRFLHFKGTPKHVTTLKSIKYIESNIWEIEDIGSVQIGDLMEVKSNKSWYYDPRPESTDGRKSELHKVVEIQSNIVITELPANDGYLQDTSEEVTVSFYTPITVNIANLSLAIELEPFVEDRAKPITGISIENCLNSHLEGLNVNGAISAGVSIRGSYNTKVVSNNVINSRDYYTGYGMQTWGSTKTFFTGNTFASCRRGIDASGGNIISLHTYIEGNSVIGSGRNSRGEYYGWDHSKGTTGAYCGGFGGHGTSDKIYMRGNTVCNTHAGFIVRSSNNEIVGNTFVGKNKYGVTCSEGIGVLIEGNVLSTRYTSKDTKTSPGLANINSCVLESLVKFYPSWNYNIPSTIKDNIVTTFGNAIVQESTTINVSIIRNHFTLLGTSTNTPLKVFEFTEGSPIIWWYQYEGNTVYNRNRTAFTELIDPRILYSGSLHRRLSGLSGKFKPQVIDFTGGSSVAIRDFYYTVNDSIVTIEGYITVSGVDGDTIKITLGEVPLILNSNYDTFTLRGQALGTAFMGHSVAEDGLLSTTLYRTRESPTSFQYVSISITLPLGDKV